MQISVYDTPRNVDHNKVKPESLDDFLFEQFSSFARKLRSELRKTKLGEHLESIKIGPLAVESGRLRKLRNSNEYAIDLTVTFNPPQTTDQSPPRELSCNLRTASYPDLFLIAASDNQEKIAYAVQHIRTAVQVGCTATIRPWTKLHQAAA